jgi:hypothetical protein
MRLFYALQDLPGDTAGGFFWLDITDIIPDFGIIFGEF